MTSGRRRLSGDDPGDQDLDGALEPELAADRGAGTPGDPEQGGHELVAVGKVRPRHRPGPDRIRASLAAGVGLGLTGTAASSISATTGRSTLIRVYGEHELSNQMAVVGTGQVVDLEGQAGLAHTLLAGDQHGAAVARADPVPQAASTSSSLDPADQG